MVDTVYVTTDSLSIEILESIKDSIDVVVPRILEMAENSKPEPYTVQNLTLASWNLGIAIFAAIFGLFGALFGYLGYKFSKQTARNVVRVSTDVQDELCYDFILDLYRNIMYAIINATAYKENKSVLSNNIIAMKLSNFNDIFHIDIYNQNSDLYIIMKHLKDRMQNYNDDILLCCNNIRKQEDITFDLDNLLIKPLRILKTVKYLLKKTDNKQDVESVVLGYLLKKHIKHIVNNKLYFNSIYTKIENNKYRLFLSENKRFIVNLEYLLKDINLNMENCIINDDDFTTKVVKDFMEIIRSFSKQTDYAIIVKKTEWTKKDVISLFINMLVIDAILDSRPRYEP